MSLLGSQYLDYTQQTLGEPSSQGISFQNIQSNRFASLEYFIECGDPDLAWLQYNYIDPRVIEPHIRTLLVNSAKTGLVKMVDALLKVKKTPNESAQTTALMVASEHGHVDVVRTLLESPHKTFSVEERHFLSIVNQCLEDAIRAKNFPLVTVLLPIIGNRVSDFRNRLLRLSIDVGDNLIIEEIMKLEPVRKKMVEFGEHHTELHSAISQGNDKILLLILQIYRDRDYYHVMIEESVKSYLQIPMEQDCDLITCLQQKIAKDDNLLYSNQDSYLSCSSSTSYQSILPPTEDYKTVKEEISFWDTLFGFETPLLEAIKQKNEARACGIMDAVCVKIDSDVEDRIIASVLHNQAPYGIIHYLGYCAKGKNALMIAMQKNCFPAFQSIFDQKYVDDQAGMNDGQLIHMAIERRTNGLRYASLLLKKPITQNLILNDAQELVFLKHAISSRKFYIIKLLLEFYRFKKIIIEDASVLMDCQSTFFEELNLFKAKQFKGIKYKKWLEVCDKKMGESSFYLKSIRNVSPTSIRGALDKEHKEFLKEFRSRNTILIIEPTVSTREITIHDRQYPPPLLGDNNCHEIYGRLLRALETFNYSDSQYFSNHLINFHLKYFLSQVTIILMKCIRRFDEDYVTFLLQNECFIVYCRELSGELKVEFQRIILRAARLDKLRFIKLVHPLLADKISLSFSGNVLLKNACEHRCEETVNYLLTEESVRTSLLSNAKDIMKKAMIGGNVIIFTRLLQEACFRDAIDSDPVLFVNLAARPESEDIMDALLNIESVRMAVQKGSLEPDHSDALWECSYASKTLFLLLISFFNSQKGVVCNYKKILCDLIMRKEFAFVKIILKQVDEGGIRDRLTYDDWNEIFTFFRESVLTFGQNNLGGISSVQDESLKRIWQFFCGSFYFIEEKFSNDLIKEMKKINIEYLSDSLSENKTSLFDFYSINLPGFFNCFSRFAELLEPFQSEILCSSHGEHSLLLLSQNNLNNHGARQPASSAAVGIDGLSISFSVMDLSFPDESNAHSHVSTWQAKKNR